MKDKFDSSLKNAFKDLFKFKFLTMFYLVIKTISDISTIALFYVSANLVDTIVASDFDLMVIYIGVFVGNIVIVIISRIVDPIVRNNFIKVLENHLSIKIINI